MSHHVFLTVASGSFGMAVGVVLDAIVIAIFGMGRQTDAYYIASTIPMAVMTILILQATRVIQPLFIHRRVQGDAVGWIFLSRVMTTGTVIVSMFCVAGIFLSPMLMKIQAASAASEEVTTATQLSIFLFCVLPLYVPVLIMRAALNSLDIFGLPGAAKFFENTSKIAFIFLLGGKLGLQSLNVGMLASAIWQLFLFNRLLKRKGFRFKFLLGLRNADMLEVYGLIGFQLTAQICDAGVQVLNNTLSSMVGTGSVTALRLASRIIESVGGILPSSVVLAAMPTIARSVAHQDHSAAKRHLLHGIKLLLMVTIPLSVWLALLNRQLIAVLYQRASFSAADTILVSNLLLALIPILVFGRLRSIFELPFFAEQNTITPLLSSVLEAAVYASSSLLLVPRFGIYGVPIGRVLSVLFAACFLGALLRRRMGYLGLRSIAESTVRILSASIIMGIFIFIANRIAEVIRVQGFISRMITLGLPSAAGLLAICFSMFAFRIVYFPLSDLVSVLQGRPLSRLLAWSKLGSTPQSD